MPIYEYTCTDCHHHFTLRRSFSEAADAAECPDCHHHQTRRVLSSFVAFAREGGTNRPMAGASICASCGAAAARCASCTIKR